MNIEQFLFSFIKNGALALCLGILVPARSHAQQGPSHLNLAGSLFQADGSPITSPSVNFKLEIYDKTGSCLLYSETHLGEDLSSTKGGFALELGRGSAINNAIDSSNPATITSKVFENSGTIAGGWTGCLSGTTLSAGDNRVIRVQYDLGGGYVAMNPDVPIGAAAYSVVAETLQGKRPSDFIQVHNDVSNKLTQANVENVFSSANYPKLDALLQGTSTQYMPGTPTSAVDFNSQVLTNVAAPVAASDATNKSYVDANIGGQAADLSGVGPAAGDGYTIIWDQSAQKWTTGTPSATDNTKLPLAGGTMAGAIDMGGFDVLATGHITISPLKTLTLGSFTSAQETALILTLTAANAGASWYNSTDKKFKVWDGSAAISQTFEGTAAGGDLTGTYPNPTIANDKITSAKIDSAGIGINKLVISDQTTGAALKFATCSTNEVLRYEDANGWVCRAPSAIVTFPVSSVNGKTGAVVLNANDLSLGTAALKDVGTAAGEIPVLDAGGKIPASLIPAMGSGDFMKDGSVAMTGDFNAGGYSLLGNTTAGANLVIESTSDSTKGFVNIQPNGGYVGIGTTAPARLLQVEGPMRLTPAALPTSPAAGDLAFDSGAANALKYYDGSAWQTVGTGTGAGDFMKDGSVAMTGDFNAGTKNLKNIGAIGIGTTNPVYGIDLRAGPALNASGIFARVANADKQRMLEFGQMNDGAGTRLSIQATNGAANAETGRTASTLLINPAGGKVQIGAPPANFPDFAGLEIWGTSGVQDSNGNVTILTTDAFAPDKGGQLVIGGMVAGSVVSGFGAISARKDNSTSMDSAGYMAFATTDASSTMTEKMRITSTGRLGIGTTSPTRLLDVAGPIHIKPGSLPTSPAAGELAFDSGAANILKFYDGSAWQSVVSSSGDVNFSSTTNTTTVGAGALNSAGAITAAGNIVASGALTGNGVTSTGSFNNVYATSSASLNIPVGASVSANNQSNTDGSAAFAALIARNTAAVPQRAYIGAVSLTGASSYTPSIVIGQQTGATAYAERMRIDTNGNLGLGTSAPTFSLSVGDGTANDGAVMALGYGAVGTNGQTLSVSGTGKRMFWYPKKAAFRAGGVDTSNPSDAAGTWWNDANIGNYSAGFGLDCKASGTFSFCAGQYSSATSSNAFATGTSTAANNQAVSMGNWNGAYGAQSLALGDHTGAWGSFAVGIGSSSSAGGQNSFVLGTGVMTGSNGNTGTGGNYSMAIGLGNPTGAKPYVSGSSSLGIFMGDQSGAQVTANNVMVVLGGNVGIGTTAPSEALDVNGAIRTRTGGIVFPDGTIQTTNGSAGMGMTSASDVNFAADTDADGGGSISMSTGGTNRLTITNAGNVGIGNAAPTAALDVTGSINLGGLNGIKYPDVDSVTGASIAIGPSALANMPAAALYGNIGIGYQVMSSASMTTAATRNTAVGYQALRAVTSGNGNTAFGWNALYNITSGSGNIGIGKQALNAATTGSSNVGIGGDQVLLNLTSGSQNIGMGNYALYSIGSGSNNIALGTWSSYSTANASNNTAIGIQSLRSNTTGSGNVVLGYQSGYDVTTGANNIFVGTYPTTAVGVTTGSNNIMMGYDVRPPSQTASNQLNIGNLIYATSLGSGATASTGSVAIGTSSPAEELTLAGTFQVNAKSASDNIWFKAYNSTGALVGQMKENTNFGSGGIQWGGWRNGNSGTAFDMNAYVQNDNGTELAGYVFNTAKATDALGTGSASVVNTAIAAFCNNIGTSFSSLVGCPVVITANGRVGIGTTTPQTTLDVNGTARLAKNSLEPFACDSAHDGAIALTHVYTLCACNGGTTTWVKTSDGTTACVW